MLEQLSIVEKHNAYDTHTHTHTHTRARARARVYLDFFHVCTISARETQKDVYSAFYGRKYNLTR